jgi:hypothetical protein
MMNRKKGNTKPHQSILSSGSQQRSYEILVRGQLDESWSDWLEGLEVELVDNGVMILYGNIKDQAALMGTLNKLYRLNLTLISVNEVTKMK